MAALFIGYIKVDLNFISEGLAGFEFHNILALYFNLLAGLGVASLAGFSVRIAKCSKANQGHPAVSFLEAFCHAVNE